MASPENILLYLPEDEERRVRDLFSALERQGFPRQHQTPHITITFARSMNPEVVDHAAALLPPIIPATLRRVGTVVFGTKRRQTVAWLLEAPAELDIAAREISSRNPEGRGPRWIPHLTVGLRLPRAIVPDYVRALDEITESHTDVLTAHRAAYWRPRTQELTVLAGPHTP